MSTIKEVNSEKLMDFLDEGRIEYDTAFAFLATWDYGDYRVIVRMVDEYCENADALNECGIRIYQYQKMSKDDGAWVDVTSHFFCHTKGEKLTVEIRPTLDNLREVMRILDENGEAEYEDWAAREGIE